MQWSKQQSEKRLKYETQEKEILKSHAVENSLQRPVPSYQKWCLKNVRDFHSPATILILEFWETFCKQEIIYIISPSRHHHLYSIFAIHVMSNVTPVGILSNLSPNKLNLTENWITRQIRLYDKLWNRSSYSDPTLQSQETWKPHTLSSSVWGI